MEGIQKSRLLLDRVNEALTVLKKKPENGERLYQLIYLIGRRLKMVIKRFFATGMTMEEVSVKMDASVEDLTSLLNS